MNVRKLSLLLAVLLLVLLSVSVLLSKNGEATEDYGDYGIKESRQDFDTYLSLDGLKIAMVSDLHVESHGYDFNLVELEALAWELKSKDVQYLILCGDNTNGGREAQHEALIDKLNEFENNGINVLVIPGNHDIGADERKDFPEKYESFGYAEAYSRDSQSLSYSLLLDDILVLMTECDCYGSTLEVSFSDETIEWIEGQLNEAKENDWKVLTVGHYPLVKGHVTRIQGRDKIVENFEKYNMPLYVCGHLHNRNVTVKGSLVELVLEKTTTYPSGYAILNMAQDGNIYYIPESLDVAQWAKASGSKDENAQFYITDGERALKEQSQATIDALCQENDASSREKKLAQDFFVSLMKNLADGTIYKNRESLLADDGYKAFCKIAKGSNYEPWIPDLFDKANPYTEGFVIVKEDLNYLIKGLY